MDIKIYLILITLILVSCSKGPDFESKIAKPEWFDSIDAPPLSSTDEVNKLWRSKKRCCIDETKLLENNREFYKVCYNAIANNPKNEELVVQCLWLMDAGADKDQRLKIKRYLVDNYSDHKNSVSRCANCAPGDTVARVTHELARNEKYQGNIDQAISRIENLFDKRGGEISLWVQTEIYTTLGNLYLSSAVTKERKNRMNDAYERLNSARNPENGVERRFPKFEKVYKQVMAR